MNVQWSLVCDEDELCNIPYGLSSHAGHRPKFGQK